MTMPLPHPQRRRFYKRWWFWLIVVIVILGVAGAGIGLMVKQQLDQATTQSQETVQVQRRDLKKTITTTGKIVSEHSEQLTFPISGRTTAVYYQAGDEVNKDDVIVKIDGGSFARSTDEELKAPFDARILAVNTFVDSSVLPNAAVVEIGYRNNVIEFVASEAEVFDVQKDQIANINIPSYDDKITYHGTVIAIEPIKNDSLSSAAAAQSGNNETGFTVQIRPTDIPAEALQFIGVTVDVEVVVAEKDNAVSIERATIQYDNNDEPFVYLPNTTMPASTVSLTGTDNLQRQDVEIGFEGDEYMEITKGLHENDTVVLYIPQADVSTPFSN